MRRLSIAAFPLLCLIQICQAQFAQLYPSMPVDPIRDIEFLNETIGFFTNAAGSIYRTTDGGMNWVRCAHYQGDAISAIRFVDHSLGFGASPFSGLWFEKVSCVTTFNEGQFWAPVDVNLSDAEDFVPVSRSLLLKANSKGIQRLDNFFGNWTTPYAMPWFMDGDVGETFGSVHTIISAPSGTLLAVASYGNARRAGLVKDSVSLLLRSTDAGLTWDTVWQGSSLLMQTLAFANPSIGWMGGEHGSIFRTSNSGAKWTIQRIDSSSQSGIQKILALDSLHAVAVNGTGTFFRTTDGGKSWTSVVIEGTPESKTALSFPTPTRGFYGGADLYATTDGGNTWKSVNPRIHAQTSKIQFISARTGWVAGDSGFYASSDGGVTWNLRNDYSANPRIGSFAMIDSLTGWAVSQKARMKTTDAGSTWASTDLGPHVGSVGGITFYDRYLGVIGDVWDEINYSTACRVTTDGGNTWEERPVTNVPYPNSWSKMQFTDPGHLWFANQQGLWLSRDTARTWTVFAPPNFNGFSSAFDLVDSVLGYSSNFPRTFCETTNGGLSWTSEENPYPEQLNDLAIIDPKYPRVPPALMVGYDGTIFEFQAGYGTRAIDSYTSGTLQSISIYREGNTAHVWILGSSFQVLYTSYLVTDVHRDGSRNPVPFKLAQNYPNPFNPGTTIRYSLPQQSHVTLNVFSTLGQLVSTLVNENQEAGNHYVRFDGTGLASGVYFYQIQAGGFVHTKKFLILR
jgi:photosystem II stability/assembly factor-like uncharacterized protein